jgi:hypothetical protein
MGFLFWNLEHPPNFTITTTTNITITMARPTSKRKSDSKFYHWPTPRFYSPGN